MDLRTSNILTCPTCRKFFPPEVKSLIRNFTILDYIYNKKDDAFGGVCPSIQGGGQSVGQQERRNNGEYSGEGCMDKFCLKHPQKKTKYFCENC